MTSRGSNTGRLFVRQAGLQTWRALWDVRSAGSRSRQAEGGTRGSGPGQSEQSLSYHSLLNPRLRLIV